MTEAIAEVMWNRFHIGPVARSHRPAPALRGSGCYRTHPAGAGLRHNGGSGLAAPRPRGRGNAVRFLIRPEPTISRQLP
ncbi:hypothetical protein, partial [Gemmobacter sp.]|uniref:hypothetical protein n=1 Tax=Gemmobacter sp. TaxID=1898957 RepID=UPI0025C18829